MTLSYGRPFRHLQPGQACYLAGLVDGEGCIRAKKIDLSREPWYPLLTIQMATLEPLATVCGWLAPNYEPRLRKDRPMWRVDWIAWRAADILDQIRPYLILKADQADLALELHAIRAGRGTGNNPRKGLVTRTPETTIARMNEIREQLMRLKKV